MVSASSNGILILDHVLEGICIALPHATGFGSIRVPLEVSALFLELA